MTENISFFLETPDDMFDLDAAMVFYRDMKVEIAAYEAQSKYLAKLDKRIKDYIKTYGQLPNVDKVETKIIQRKGSSFVDLVVLKGLAADIRHEGHPDIADRILDCIYEKGGVPAIKFIFDDLKVN